MQVHEISSIGGIHFFRISGIKLVKSPTLDACKFVRSPILSEDRMDKPPPDRAMTESHFSQEEIRSWVSRAFLLLDSNSYQCLPLDLHLQEVIFEGHQVWSHSCCGFHVTGKLAFRIFSSKLVFVLHHSVPFLSLSKKECKTF